MTTPTTHNRALLKNPELVERPFRQAQGPEFIEGQRTRLRVTACAAGNLHLCAHPHRPRRSGVSLSFWGRQATAHVMNTPQHFIDYRCSDYFDSDRFTQGVCDELAQLCLVVSADEVVECPVRQFLVIGRPGVDGIEFGYRRNHDGIWAHYPIEDEFRFIAPSVSALVDGWLTGSIKV